jgi:hypothetical protein
VLVGQLCPSCATHVHASDGLGATTLSVRALAHRPRCGGVLKYFTRHYTSESAGNQKESNMYIGGGLLLLLIVLFLVLR